jgi:hypothetical protein
VCTVTIAVSRPAAGADKRAEAALQFDDVAEASGLKFTHHSPLTEERHLHLTMGSGVGWLDYDRDGFPDLYFAQGKAWSGPNGKPSTPPKTDRLFRNLGGRFEDVTEHLGVSNAEYAMGIAAGDMDNDGFPDLYVSNFGRNRMFLNNGDGTFQDGSAATGTDDPRYAASSTWTDIDGDGNLDLYVTNYLLIDPVRYTLCSQVYRGRTVKLACPPRRYPWPRDLLFRNSGDGRFTDVTKVSGISSIKPAAGLGVVTGDFDGDDRLDLYVANDTTANFLLINKGGGRFVDRGLVSGTALNRIGDGEAGMGVAAGDVDGDGRIDLFVTNYYGETNTLYRNEGKGLFLDVTDEWGLAAPSRTRLGFGTLLADFDHDGRLDLFVANGHLNDRLPRIGQDVPFQQQSQVFRNDRGRRFLDASVSAGPYFQRKLLGRGCAAADFDRDGRLDVAVQHLNGKAVLLRNRSRAQGPPLILELVGTRGNRDAIGARVEIDLGSTVLVRQRDGSSSYLSCSEGRMIVGIGSRRSVKQVRIRWPGGATEAWNNVKAGEPVWLVEGRASRKVERKK